jgi:ParB-like chromosome segregation protein Spo0J
MNQQWPAETVQRAAVSSLIPYARNARTHTDAQVSQVAASIREFGFTNPVLVSEDNTIIAGHARVMAAQKLGLAEVPVMVARGWSEAQKRAYVLADNKLALNAGWDDDLLRVELGDLKLADFDLALTGFDIPELAALLEDPSSGMGVGETIGLAERFGVAPFTVLNAREGWWQDRKRAWIALGIQSELGRR